MIPPPLPPPEKPQCVHRNDADNCLLCGTRPLRQRNSIMTGANDQHIQLESSSHCDRHRMPRPCWCCEAELEVGARRRAAQQALVESINAVSVKIWDEIRRAEHNARWPGGKCVHGHYLAEDYCQVCSLNLIEPGYDVDLYRREITKALSNAQRALGGITRNTREADRMTALQNNETIDPLTEGQKNFADIEMLVDLEVWKATKKYGDEMNGKLAYKIARNVAQQYLGDLIAEATVLTGLALEFMSDKDAEEANRLLSEYGDAEGLTALANDWRANAEDRTTARRLINEYGERVPRFASFDVMVVDGEGTTGDVSAPELEINAQKEQAKLRAQDVGDTFEAHRPELTALVATWYGPRKLVGEAILAGTFTVRGVPGVDKNKASQLYKVVSTAFKVLISRGLKR